MKDLVLDVQDWPLPLGTSWSAKAPPLLASFFSLQECDSQVVNSLIAHVMRGLRPLGRRNAVMRRKPPMSYFSEWGPNEYLYIGMNLIGEGC